MSVTPGIYHRERPPSPVTVVAAGPALALNAMVGFVCAHSLVCSIVYFVYSLYIVVYTYIHIHNSYIGAKGRL